MEEIYKKISAHYIKGMMFHDQMTNYYDFLGLRGYKRCHEYNFYKDTIAYRKINRYYINHHGGLIPEMKVEDPGIIPESWYRYKREDVDVQTKRNAVESAITKYIDWEQETKTTLEASIKELCDNNMIADALFLNGFLREVDCELKKAMRKMIDLKSSNYDISNIVLEQDCIHDKYKKKMKELIG